jgi:geranylgeranyl diphosphate synthase type II
MSVETPSIVDYLRARRAEVDAALESALPAPPECPQVIFDAMRYSLMAGGKRLRPILCLASAEAVASRAGMDVTQVRALAMPAACALEMIHTYSLIHDDLPAMDNDTMRRGRPTLHVVAGEGMAILAGDGLLTEALALVARRPETSDPVMVDRKLRAVVVIATAAGAAGMVGGQAIDLSTTPGGAHHGATPGIADPDSLRTMHSKKTGALIHAAAVAGAIMAGADAAAIAAVRDCGAHFGLAFQITDDILDVEGSTTALGKTAGKDAAAGKPTYASLYGVDASRRMAHDCIERAERSLSHAGLAGTPLMAIGRWIIERQT